MKTPGFTAERSFFRAGRHYRTAGGSASSSRRDGSGIHLQLADTWCSGVCDSCLFWSELCWAYGNTEYCHIGAVDCDACAACEALAPLTPAPPVR